MSSSGATSAAVDLPPKLPKLADQCCIISSFTSDCFERKFFRRALGRGTVYAMEGYVDDLKVSKVADQYEVIGRCWESFSKNVRCAVSTILDKELAFVDSNCQCTARLNACSHAAAVLLFVAKLCGHFRLLSDSSDTGDEHGRNISRV